VCSSHAIDQQPYGVGVAYDDLIAARLSARLASEPAITEQKMFGGVGFMAAGNLAVGASSSGGLIVRADPETSEDLLHGPGVELMEMRGRPMRGWIHVDPDRIESDSDLEHWVGIGLAYARSLPPKT
jgi:TfoX/Sxy family transcriptional regulator of competence genes